MKSTNTIINNPDMAKEWDYEKNGGIRPEEVSLSSRKYFWWRCHLGHSWSATPNRRYYGRKGCPYCVNQKVLAGYNDLLSRSPELASQWDYEKNAPLKPDMVTLASPKKVWWKCKHGHSWQASLNSRSSSKSGCPYCKRTKVLAGYNDLLSRSPELASQWDYEKNDPLKPDMVTLGSPKKVWWKCEHGHSWQASLNSRSSRKTGCPYCSSVKVRKGFNDLATKAPELAKQWDYEKNGSLRPEMVAQFSSKKVWWKCKHGHSWQASLNSRSSSKSGCPYCKRTKVLAGYNDLLSRSPELASQWDCEKNAPLKPDMVTLSSPQKVWWKCKLGHSWQASPNSRSSKKSGCPYCSGLKAWKGFNDLATKAPELAKQWDYEKNGSLRPEDVHAKGCRKVWWKCTNGHSWRAKPYDRYIMGNGCPICSGLKQMRTHFIM